MLAAAVLLALQVTNAVRVPVDDTRVVVVGHVVREGGAAVLSWPASELRARFTGTSLAIELEEQPAPPSKGAAKSTAPDAGPVGAGAETDRLVVVVDGKRSDVALAPGQAVVRVAEGLKRRVHDVSIVKRTEPLVGSVAVRALVLDDGATLAAPPHARPRRIEVIGDSLATGYGVSGKGPDCPFSAGTEDVTRSFAALVARRFGADLVDVAWSGRGAYRDFAGDTAPPSLPALWAEAAAKAPLARAPDAVLVELGANDLLTPHADRGAFMRAYHGLLDGVRRAYPHAWIVLLAPMPPSTAPDDPVLVTGNDWMNAVLHKRGDPRLSWVKLPGRDDALGLGCTWHPGPRMHEKLAGPVAAELARRLRW